MNQANNNRWTALFSASLQGHSDVVKLLLGTEGTNVNQADEYGETALYGLRLYGTLYQQWMDGSFQCVVARSFGCCESSAWCEGDKCESSRQRWKDGTFQCVIN